MENETPNLGRTWHEIRNKTDGKLVFCSTDHDEAEGRLEDCWPAGEFELVTVRELIKK